MNLKVSDDDVAKTEPLLTTPKNEAPKKIKELCFSGGHYQSLFLYIGALIAIKENKFYDLSEVQRYVGTSSGAILAFFLCLGFELRALTNVFKRIPTEKFFKIKSQNFLYLFDDLGMYDTKQFKSIFEVFLAEKGYKKQITFLELYELTQTDLSFTTYCVNSKKMIILNYLFTPELEVAKGLTMSIAIPLICKPVSYKNQLYIDPCIICNFPVDYVKNEEYLGFALCVENKYEEKFTFISFLKNIYYSIYDEFMNIKVSQYNDSRVFLIPSEQVSNTSFVISEETIDKYVFDGNRKFKELYDKRTKN
jgi:predicted acylesterase/phospholipase RssA